LNNNVITFKPLDILNLFSEFISRNLDGRSGAVLIYIGVVRRYSDKRHKISKFILNVNNLDKAESEFKRAVIRIKDFYELNDVCLKCSIGEHNIGEPIVFIGVSAETRMYLFEAVRELVNMVKQSSYISKHEE